MTGLASQIGRAPGPSFRSQARSSQQCGESPTHRPQPVAPQRDWCRARDLPPAVRAAPAAVRLSGRAVPAQRVAFRPMTVPAPAAPQAALPTAAVETAPQAPAANPTAAPVEAPQLARRRAREVWRPAAAV